MIISCSALLITIQPTSAKNADDQTVTAIKLSALKAESIGDLAKAEFLYLKALAESEKTGSTLRILESLVHVVHIKTIRGKLKEAEPFYKRAIDVAQNAMRKPGCNAEVTVWLDDLADAYYSAGQFTNNKKIKEFCLQHYIDSKMLCSTKYDPELITKINLLSSHYMMEGRYAEAERINEKARIVTERNANRPKVAGFNLGSSPVYLMQKKFEQAEKAYQEGLKEDLSADPKHSDFYQALFERRLGLIQFEKSDLDAAEAHFKKASSLHRNYPQQTYADLALDNFLLGFAEEQKCNPKSASEYYEKALSGYKMCAQSTPSQIVLCMEHLSAALKKQNRYQEANSLSIMASKLRTQHREWTAISNPDPERHFRICGSLPFPIDIIPTRTVTLF